MQSTDFYSAVIIMQEVNGRFKWNCSQNHNPFEIEDGSHPANQKSSYSQVVQEFQSLLVLTHSQSKARRHWEPPTSCFRRSLDLVSKSKHHYGRFNKKNHCTSLGWSQVSIECTVGTKKQSDTLWDNSTSGFRSGMPTVVATNYRRNLVHRLWTRCCQEPRGREAVGWARRVCVSPPLVTLLLSV